MESQERLLFTVPQFVLRHEFISDKGMQLLILNSKNNGLERIGAILRVGGKVMIDEKKYFAWVELFN